MALVHSRPQKLGRTASELCLMGQSLWIMHVKVSQHIALSNCASSSMRFTQQCSVGLHNQQQQQQCSAEQAAVQSRLLTVLRLALTCLNLAQPSSAVSALRRLPQASFAMLCLNKDMPVGEGAHQGRWYFSW